MPMTEIPAGTDKLVLVGEISHLAPAYLFDYWTKPELLCQWWPRQAFVEPQRDGRYHFSWPAMNWHLRGRYTSFEPGHTLVFSWNWDHEPENTSGTAVTVTFSPLAAGGTQMKIIHEPYTDTQESQEKRASHLEGWNHFFSRLQKLQPSR